MTQYVLVTILSHALCEAAINAILALGLTQINSQKRFAEVEKKEIQKRFAQVEKEEITEKWLFAPKIFFPNYDLPKGEALFGTLKYLKKQRNALVHSKIRVDQGDKKILKGSELDRRPLAQNIEWMHRFFSLPYDLSEHARSQPNGHSIFILHNRDPILRADVHKKST